MTFSPRSEPRDEAGAGDPSQETEAKLAFTEGRRAFEDGRFADALVAFHRAYALTGHSALLFDVALAADRLRDDPAALDAFERYLKAEPAARDRAQIEQRIAALRAAIARRKAQGEAQGEPGSGNTHVPTPAQAAATLQVKDPSAEARTAPASEPGSVLERWWFWTALGVVAAGTVTAVLVLEHDPGTAPSSPPKSGLVVMTLGASR